MTLSLSTIAPAGAGAFIWPGESAVLNPAKTDLTGPAKTILTNPTFLPETTTEARAVKGVAEASRIAGLFQTSTILPALGSVLSFGVGTVIGSEICNAIGIEGCWYFGSEGADPAPGTSGSWQFQTAGLYPYNWRWSKTETYFAGLFGVPPATESACGLPVPNGVDQVQQGSTDEGCGAKYGAVSRSSLWRWSMSNRVLDYHATDDPEIGNYSHTASSDWSNKLAAALKEQPEGSPGAHLGEHIASKIEGSGVVSPFAVFVDVPSCSGEAWIGCKEQLEELELIPERVELTWEDAHLDLAPDTVIELAPAPATKVETGTKVTVTTNPDEAGMPIVIPARLPGETYDDYIARLAPLLTPNRVTVSPEFTDPTAGPDGVVRTVPKEGTRLDPEVEIDLDVHTNPADAPPPATSSWTAPAIPAIDLSPLAGVSIGCNDFPFGIFCWIGSGLTSWGPGGECPTIGVPMGSSIGLDDELAFDLCQFEPAMEIVRPVLILLSAFCLAYLFAAAAMGFGGSTGSED